MSWLNCGELCKGIACAAATLMIIFLTAGLLTFFLGYYKPMKNSDDYPKAQCIIVNNSVETECEGGDKCDYIGIISIKTREETNFLSGSFSVANGDTKTEVEDKLQQDYSIGFPITCYTKNHDLSLEAGSKKKNMVAFVFGIVLLVLAGVFLVVAIASYWCGRDLDE